MKTVKDTDNLLIAQELPWQHDVNKVEPETSAGNNVQLSECTLQADTM
jgi:hypothetical protein